MILQQETRIMVYSPGQRSEMFRMIGPARSVEQVKISLKRNKVVGALW
jgi:hypothetical protein